MNYRNFGLKALIVYLALMALVVIAANVHAADKVLDTTVQSAVTAIDSRGNEYVRLIINEERNLNGISYTVGVPVMIFSSNPAELEKAKLLKAGDSFKAVVSGREFQGRMSYIVIQFLS